MLAQPIAGCPAREAGQNRHRMYDTKRNPYVCRSSLVQQAMLLSEPCFGVLKGHLPKHVLLDATDAFLRGYRFFYHRRP